MTPTDLPFFKKRTSGILGVILLLSGLTGVALLDSRSDFMSLFFTYSVAFSGYLLIIFYSASAQLHYKDYLIALAAMAVFLFISPLLSDDYYRFAWDGYLQLKCVSPYAFTPSSLMIQDTFIHDPYLISLYPQLNSPDYYSVYPPVMQLVFYGIAYFSGDSIRLFILMIQFTMIISCIGVIFFSSRLLTAFSFPSARALIFALNPLVIIEGVGNLHFELIQVFMLSMALYFLHEKKLVWASIAFGLSISVKLLPLLMLPLIFRFLGTRQGILFVLVSITVFVLSFIPVSGIDEIAGMINSIDLYFRKFEFNASVYYLLRETGYWIKGYNTIGVLGPLLAIITILCICYLFIKLKRGADAMLYEAFVAVFTIFFLFSTTVHPWYIITLLFFIPFTLSWFVVIWTWLVFLSYSAYRADGFQENFVLIATEYVIVMLMIVYRSRISLFVAGKILINSKSIK